jgi:hypothetical protein
MRKFTLLNIFGLLLTRQTILYIIKITAKFQKTNKGGVQ